MAHNIAGWFALGWPDIIFENLAQTTRIPGWGRPSIKSSRPAQPAAADQRPPLLTAGAYGGGCQCMVVTTIVVSNAVISDDRELGLLRACSAASLINSFSADNLFVRCLARFLPSVLFIFLSFAVIPITHWLLPNLPSH